MPARDGRVANLVSVMAQSLLALASTGVVRPYRPDKLFRLAKTLAYWGTGPARGPLTFDEIHRRTNAVANALAGLGVQEGDLVGLLARNHRGFVDATVGVAKLGADVLYLNTGFAGPQLVEVLEREQAIALVYDEEFAPLVDAVPDSVHKLVAWRDNESVPEGQRRPSTN